MMEVDVVLLLILFTNILVLSHSSDIEGGGKETQREYRLITIPLFYDENYYFDLIEPEELHYFYRIRQAKNFGVLLNRTFTKVELVPVVPHHGCADIENKEYLKNSFALVERGQCSFLSKSVNAEKAGAVGVIIYDNDRGNDDKMIDMVQDETSREVNIPAFFLMGKDGHIIVSAVERYNLRSAVINIPINVTGIPVATLHGNRPPWTLW